MPVQALRSVAEHFDTILRQIHPRRLLTDMAKADKAFHFRYLKGQRIEKMGRGKVNRIARREVLEGDGNELLANLIVIYWNNIHGKMYEEMVAHVQTLNEDVEQVERILPEQAHPMIDDMLSRHERDDLYVCVRLNGVRFDEEIIQSRLVRGEPAPPAADSAAPADQAVVDAASDDVADAKSDDDADAGTPAE